MNSIEVKFKRLFEDVEIPTKAHVDDAGFDIQAFFEKNRSGMRDDIILFAGQSTLIKCGFCLEIPSGYEAQVRSRSGLSLKNQIIVLNSPGTIDSSYRGEIGVILANFSNSWFRIEHGMRIAQLVFNKIPNVVFNVSEKLSDSSRDADGFGSSGVFQLSNINY